MQEGGVGSDRQPAERFVDIAEASRSAVLALTPVGVILHANAAAERLLGRTAAELCGQPIEPLFAPASRGVLQMNLDAAGRGIPALEATAEIAASKRHPCRIVYTLVPQYAGETLVAHLLVFAALGESSDLSTHDENAALKLLAENIAEVLYLRNAERMLYVNPVYERLWGRPIEELYRDRLAFINAIHPEDMPRVQRAVKAQARGVPFQEEYRIVRPDGSVRWIRARSFLIDAEDQESPCVGGIAEDITELKQAEAERHEREQAFRATLVREVHHRIKNHLQGVVGLLRQHMVVHPEARGPLLDALGQVQSIAIVHGLQGQQCHEVRLCELVPAIVQTVQDLDPRAAALSVDMAIEHRVQVKDEQAVPVALIINELIFNAVKHNPRRDEAVRIRFESGAGRARLRLLTAGARLPAGFDFERGQGLGTGLALLKSLLPVEGSRLSIRETPEGVSTELELMPPIIEPEQGGPASCTQ